MNKHSGQRGKAFGRAPSPRQGEEDAGGPLRWPGPFKLDNSQQLKKRLAVFHRQAEKQWSELRPRVLSALQVAYQASIEVCRDRYVLSRYSAHAAMLLLVIGALILAQIRLPATHERTGTDFEEGDLGQYILTTWGDSSRIDEGYLMRSVVPHTTRADPKRQVALGGGVTRDPAEDNLRLQAREARAIRLDRSRTEMRTEILKYSVQSGDNVYGLAERFGVTPETIVWANEKLLGNNPDRLSIGDELLIPPVSGVVHTVQKDDTLEKIAKSYNVDPSVIVAFALNNILDPARLTVGQMLVVPGGEKPQARRPAQLAQARQAQPATRSQPQSQPAPARATAPETAVVGSGQFRWPTVGVITQKYWSRHPGIDIAGPKGTPVYAADGGTVIEAGWNTWGFGYTVVIDHGNGYQTRYSHLSWFNPSEGQKVEKGELIGQIGSTGRSTGPHLDFRIYKNGQEVNPLTLLR